MDENVAPKYWLTKISGGKTNQQLQTNSPKPADVLYVTRKSPKATAFKIKCIAIKTIMVKNPQP